MDYAAQPPGTTADQALTNRGPDPDVIAASTYAFFNAIRSIVCHRQVAGNRLASPNSVITSLIGGFFLTLDTGVLAGSPASSLPSPQALADLVAFLEHIGCNFAGKRYKTDEELWSDVRASGYDEFLEWLSSAESASVHPLSAIVLRLWLLASRRISSSRLEPSSPGCGETTPLRSSRNTTLSLNSVQGGYLTSVLPAATLTSAGRPQSRRCETPCFPSHLTAGMLTVRTLFLDTFARVLVCSGVSRSVRSGLP